MLKDELIELLSDKEHAGWAHWMEYLFSKCEKGVDDALIIPPALVERWQRQIDTAYAKLSEQEKQSDRNQVADILPFIEAYTEPLRQLLRDMEAWAMDIAPWSFQDSRKTVSIRERLQHLLKEETTDATSATDTEPVSLG